MAPRKPKNPIQDIINTTSAWLGGNRGTINPQVARVSRDLGTVAQTIDTFTGGFGAAAGRDARNFQQGGSLPTNLAKTAAVNLAAGAAGAKAAQVAAKTAASVKAVRQANKLDWDPKPFVEGVRTPDRASFYWKPETDVVNPMNPDVSYSVAVRPANPKAARSAPRSTDKGYKVEVSRFSENRVNEMFDSAADYNKIVGAKPSSSVNAPTSDQLFRSLQSNKVYKDLQKAQRAAERLVKRDIKRR